MSRGDLQKALALAHRDHFTEAYLQPALKLGLVEPTIPDKPRSSKQRYRLSAQGRAWLANHKARK
jgi:ATP-dependent DNA helicase RecG